MAILGEIWKRLENVTEMKSFRLQDKEEIKILTEIVQE